MLFHQAEEALARFQTKLEGISAQCKSPCDSYLVATSLGAPLRHPQSTEALGCCVVGFASLLIKNFEAFLIRGLGLY